MEFALFLFEQDSRSLQKFHRLQRVQLTASLIWGKRKKGKKIVNERECVWERVLGWGKRRRQFTERGRPEGMKLPIKFIVRKVILQTRSCLFHIKKPKYPQFGVLPKAQQLGDPEENAALLPDTSASCGGICNGWRKRQIKGNDFHT